MSTRLSLSTFQPLPPPFRCLESKLWILYIIHKKTLLSSPSWMPWFRKPQMGLLILWYCHLNRQYHYPQDFEPETLFFQKPKGAALWRDAITPIQFPLLKASDGPFTTPCQGYIQMHTMQHKTIRLIVLVLKTRLYIPKTLLSRINKLQDGQAGELIVLS